LTLTTAETICALVVMHFVHPTSTRLQFVSFIIVTKDMNGATQFQHFVDRN